MTRHSRRYQRRTPEQWQALFDEHQCSGQSQKAFCQEKGLVPATFRNWKRRLSDTASDTTSSTHDWLELPLGPAASCSKHWDIELELGNGLCLRLRHR